MQICACVYENEAAFFISLYSTELHTVSNMRNLVLIDLFASCKFEDRNLVQMTILMVTEKLYEGQADISGLEFTIKHLEIYKKCVYRLQTIIRLKYSVNHLKKEEKHEK